jgi:hypothetical protein
VPVLASLTDPLVRPIPSEATMLFAGLILLGLAWPLVRRQRRSDATA